MCWMFLGQSLRTGMFSGIHEGEIKHYQRTENRRGYHQYESLTFGQAHSKVESKSLMSWVVTHFTKAVQDLSSFLL